MTKFERLDPRKCARLAVQVANVRGKYGKVSAIVSRWAEKEGRDVSTIWEWLKIGRIVIRVQQE